MVLILKISMLEACGGLSRKLYVLHSLCSLSKFYSNGHFNKVADNSRLHCQAC